MDRHVVAEGIAKRGLSASDRSARIKNNPLRAAAIVKGRQRLAKVAEQLNPGFRPLSTLRLASGFSQAELAEKMNMKQPNIARLEKSLVTRASPPFRNWPTSLVWTSVR